MVHAHYCGYWWELYRTVTATPNRTLQMDDDLGELIKVSEEIAGSAEIVGMVLPFLGAVSSDSAVSV